MTQQRLFPEDRLRVIIAGSRTFNDYEFLCEVVASSNFQIRTVLSGCATGVDALGERWAREHGTALERYPANWAGEGMKAGAIRNKKMALSANALIAIWDGRSAGTRNMIKIATDLGLRCCIIVNRELA